MCFIANFHPQFHFLMLLPSSGPAVGAHVIRPGDCLTATTMCIETQAAVHKQAHIVFVCGIGLRVTGPAAGHCTGLASELTVPHATVCGAELMANERQYLALTS